MALQREVKIHFTEEQLRAALIQHKFAELKERTKGLESGSSELKSNLKPLSPNENFVVSIGNALEYFSNNRVERHDEVCDALMRLLEDVSLESLTKVVQLASEVPGARSELVTVLSASYSTYSVVCTLLPMLGLFLFGAPAWLLLLPIPFGIASFVPALQLFKANEPTSHSAELYKVEAVAEQLPELKQPCCLPAVFSSLAKKSASSTLDAVSVEQPGSSIIPNA